jgi:tetratricopeptide (TPR) repeat protein
MLLLMLSSLSLRTGHLEEAEALFNEAIFLLYRLENDQPSMIRSYRRSGIAFRLFDSLRRAHFYLEESQKGAHSGGHLLEEGWALSELGETSAESGHAQKAINYHQQALAFFQQSGGYVWEQEQLLRLARVQACAGKWREAEKIGKQVQAVAQQQAEWIGELRASISLGIMALFQENTSGYIQQLRLAMSVIPEEGLPIKTRIQQTINQSSIWQSGYTKHLLM